MKGEKRTESWGGLDAALRELLRNSDDYVFVKDTDLIYRAVSDAAAKRGGFASGEELVGKTDYDIFPQETADRHRDEDRRVMETGVAIEGIMERLTDADGEARWVQTWKHPLLDDDDKVIGVYGVSHDVTKTVELETKVDRERNRYESVVEYAELLTWEYDILNHRIVMSDTDATQAEIDRSALPNVMENVPESIVELIEDEYVPAFLDMYRKIEGGAPRASCEVWYKTKADQEPRCERIAYTTVFDDEGKPVSAHGIGQIITWQKSDEARYERARKQLMQANSQTIASFRLNLTKNWVGDGKSKVKSVLKQQEKGTVDSYFIEFSKVIADDAVQKWFLSNFDRKKLIRGVAEGLTEFSFEYPVIYQNGTRHWSEGHLDLFQNPKTGDIEGVTYALDIDKRKHAELISKAFSDNLFDFSILLDMTTGKIISGGQTEQGAKERYQDEDYAAPMMAALQNMMPAEALEAAIDAHSIETIERELAGKDRYEVALTTKDGRHLHWNISYADRENAIVLIIREDVTEAFRKEQKRIGELEEERRARQKTSALLQGILDTAPFALFWKDADRRFEGANKAFLDFYGFKSLDDILGKNDEDMGWHPDPGPYKNDEQRVIEKGERTNRVPGECMSHGELCHIVASKSPRYENGRIVGLVGSFEDVTTEVLQRREIERLNAELKKRLDEHNLLLGTAEVCVIKVRLPDYVVVEYNDALCKLTGYTRKKFEQMFGANLETYFGEAHRDAFDEFIKAAAEMRSVGKKRFSFNLQVPTKKGDAWVGGSAAFASVGDEDAGPECLYMIFSDITDIVDAQKKLGLAEIEMQKAALLKEQNEGLRRMIDGVPSGLGAISMVRGKAKTKFRLNRYFTERVDIAVDDDRTINRHKFLSCLHPDDRDRARKDFYDLLKKRELAIRQYRFRSVAGNYYWCSVRGTIVPISDDEEIAYFIYTDIDSLKAAEAELQESRRNYERTVDDLQVGMWTFDIPNRRIVLGDNASTEALRVRNGWPKVFENVPESLLDTVEPDEWENYLAMFRNVEAGHDASCEVWYRQRPGAEAHCERESYRVVTDADGNPVKAYGIGVNITAQKKVEERYAREMAYLRDNSDESLVAKGHYNLTKNVVLEYDVLNNKNAFVTKPGTTCDEAFDQFVGMSYSDDDRRELADKMKRENLMRRYQQGQMQATMQYRRAVEGQSPVWHSMTVHTFMNPQTGDLELFSYAYDVTERKLFESVMDVVSRQAFDYIALLHVSDGSFEFLEKADYIEYPALRQKVTFVQRCEYVSSNFVDEGEKAQFETATSLVRVLAALHTSTFHTETYLRTEHGKVLCKQMDYLWHDQKAGDLLVIRTDVSAAYERDQRQLAEIESAKLEAERANDAKSTFLSSMSHDLRTPLSGVLGFTSFALAEPDAQKKQEYLKKIDSSGKLLLDLVNDTLELSRVESGKMALEPEVVMPVDLVPAVVTALRPSAELKSIALVEDYDFDKNIPVRCDKLKVQKIALNLISNAIKYTPEGGTVKVSMASAPAVAKGCVKSLTVEDNGIGMSEEFMGQMFEPFAQEKRSEAQKTPGTGLGLAIVKRYVDLMGGTIAADSVLHKGTRWVVELPIDDVPGETAHVGEAQAPASDIDISGQRVLICEDNYMNTEIASTLLKEQGAQVETAENGKAGLDLFDNSEPGYFNAILMDMRMPIMGGLEATRRIRALARPDAKSVRIVAMTADAFEESIREAKDAGMNAYLTKPIDPKKLYAALAGA